MIVRSIHLGCDTGGTGIRLAEAFARRQDLHIDFRSVCTGNNYIQYPHDLPGTRHTAQQAYDEADVVHLHNGLGSGQLLARQLPLKPALLHFHGTEFRTNHSDHAAKIATLPNPSRICVSTLGLLNLEPGVTWIPQVCDPTKLRAMRPHPITTNGRKLRIGHAPTNRAIKSTDAFLAACEELDVEPVLIERRDWTACNNLKATCDIYFDQVILGYGNSAIEAWAMGIPVICGAATATLTTMREQFDGDLPFYLADENSITDAIRDLTDEDLRAEYAERGHTHMTRWHDGTETTTRLATLYEELTPAPVATPTSTATPAAVTITKTPPTPTTSPRPRTKTGTGTHDLVIRTSKPTEELRHAIRSLTANIPHRELYTAGAQIPWLNCHHITVPLTGHAFTQAYTILRAILACDDLTPDVIIADADMYALLPMPNLPAHHCGKLADLPPRSASRARAIAATIKHTSPDVPCRDMHIPTLVNRAQLADQLDALPLAEHQRERILWRTLHAGGDPTYHPDAKARTATEPIPSEDWLSTNPASFAGIAGAYIRQAFPHPTPWETDMQDHRHDA